MGDAGLVAAPHRRWNPLIGEWLLVSSPRTARPWQGQVETAPVEERPAYDPTCYLCPSNARRGVRKPDCAETFVFENDYAALRPDAVPQALTRTEVEGVKLGIPSIWLTFGDRRRCDRIENNRSFTFSSHGAFPYPDVYQFLVCLTFWRFR